MKNQKNYYLGLDIGTDSVGYAAALPDYSLLKYRGKPAWGVTVFDEAATSAERRAFRTARRRLDRRQQRVLFVQELFAKEITKKDPRFFIRQQESYLFRSESQDAYVLFCDETFTDKEYYIKYPTIHHLIVDLMESDTPHDVRLVYLACAWLVAHRGHFLSSIGEENLEQLKDLSSAYEALLQYFIDNEVDLPWTCRDADAVGKVLKAKTNVTKKKKALTDLFFDGEKIPKDDYPYSREKIISLLAGGSCAVKDLFYEEDYADTDPKSITLGMEEEKFAALEEQIGEDYALIRLLRAIYDWSVLNDILNEEKTISQAKVKVYEQHKADLRFLKAFIRRHLPEKYDEVFRNVGKDNYTAYSGHTQTDQKREKKAGKEGFSKRLMSLVKAVQPEADEAQQYEDMLVRLELRTFLPKQRDPDNRVIPHQLYLFEMKRLLQRAAVYLPFLNEADADGITVSEKLLSVFRFRVPYFVGPLNARYAPDVRENRRPWFVRRSEGKIRPWNFEKTVDLDASEEQFIRRMTNQCTYLPGEPVLPKHSLLYHRFMVLNEINNLRIHGERISVDLKQKIYTELFLRKKKVTIKALTDFLIRENVIGKGEQDAVSGIDQTIKADLTPQIAFRSLFERQVLTETEAEHIIERSTYMEDRSRFSKWLAEQYPQLSEADRKYLCGQRWKDFGRLSRYFLNELAGTDENGEVFTILSALWNTQNNLMELLSDRFTFRREVERMQRTYFDEQSFTLEDRLEELRVSAPVRRCIYRTLAVVRDVEKAFGKPEKIFIEMPRGAKPEQKNRRTQSRREQILALYEKCKDEDVRELQRQLEALGEAADSRLQGDKLFLYFMQLGKCLYTGKIIDITKLGSGDFNIEHIYPQSYVKDDSIINNEILVYSKANGEKSDIYPVSPKIQREWGWFWRLLREKGLMSEEKYRRLTRTTPFSAEEKTDFINRQLTETAQAAKAVAEILKSRCPEAEIVYCKAGLVSDFRREFGLPKSRSFNDLHHASDAYLNIVTGNVFGSRFTKQWFDPNRQYSVKTKTLYTHPVMCGSLCVWDGASMLEKVKKQAMRQDAHFNKFAYIKKGGFFDQMPVTAAEGLTPLKKGRDTARYGGYNKASVAFFLPVRYTTGKKREIVITSVQLLFADRVLADPDFAKAYLKTRVEAILGKAVTSVELPMGLRPWKVNTMLSLDGFRVCIAGSANAGKSLIAQPVVQFMEEPQWVRYLKRVESLIEKMDRNSNYLFDEAFDGVSVEQNAALYALYIEKLQNGVYAKRVNNPVGILIQGKDRFLSLPVPEQCRALLHIHGVFGRQAGGCDLRAVGGAEHAAATVSFSSAVSNWKKTYKDVRLLDVSPSGLWEKRSENLLEIL